MFGKNRFSVRRDLEHPAGAGHQLDFVTKRAFDLLRQTGGAGIIVSDLTVGNNDFHLYLLARNQPVN